MIFLQLHRELAREAVRKSMVLLKNHGRNSGKHLLPLTKNAKRILIAGTHADDLGYQCGGWTKSKYGMSGGITIGTSGYRYGFFFEDQLPNISLWQFLKTCIFVMTILTSLLLKGFLPG